MCEIAVFIAFLLVSGTVEAQLFRRQNKTMHQSQGGHWGYPGDIAAHLATTHGQSVSGLSHEQMMSLHDAIHEGRAVQKPLPRPAIPMRIENPKRKQEPAPVVVIW